MSVLPYKTAAPVLLEAHSSVQAQAWLVHTNHSQTSLVFKRNQKDWHSFLVLHLQHAKKNANPWRNMSRNHHMTPLMVLSPGPSRYLSFSKKINGTNKNQDLGAHIFPKSEAPNPPKVNVHGIGSTWAVHHRLVLFDGAFLMSRNWPGGSTEIEHRIDWFHMILQISQYGLNHLRFWNIPEFKCNHLPLMNGPSVIVSCTCGMGTNDTRMPP